MNGQQKISIPEELSTTWLFYTSGACVWLPLPSFSMMYFHLRMKLDIYKNLMLCHLIYLKMV